MKARLIEPPNTHDSIPDTVLEMVNNPGVYIVSIPEYTAALGVINSDSGKLWSMRAVRPADPAHFPHGALIDGPFRPGDPNDDKNDQSFGEWWYEHGSGILPVKGDDMESHAERVAHAAWVASSANKGENQL